MPHAKGNVFAGALLVAGTSIGGGMLALPVLTSYAGFLPSVVVYVICWLFMASTGLLFLEVSQWMKGESNILSMANQILGRPGKIFAWVVYLFLFYCLTVAYMVACGDIMAALFKPYLSDRMGSLIFTLLFAPLLLVPTGIVSRLNIFLVAGLALSYFGFVLVGLPYVDHSLLQSYQWSYSLSVLPIAFTSFAYQGIIPTLATHMHHDGQAIRRAILIGSSIPLIAYIIWEWLILGIVPIDGPYGLHEALNQGLTAVQPLKHFINNPAVYGLGHTFAFFALITSFIGVSLGLRDFLADGLSIKKQMTGKLLLSLFVLGPPLFIAMVFPNIFLIALDYAGGFGCALLLGLLPIVLVWIGRYHLKYPLNEQLPCGRFMLFLLGGFVSLELISETLRLIQRLISYI